MGAIEPEQILRDLLALDPTLRRERYYGERAIFYNPGGVAPLGVIFAAIKDRGQVGPGAICGATSSRSAPVMSDAVSRSDRPARLLHRPPA
jgi:hypothetical protein